MRTLRNAAFWVFAPLWTVVVLGGATVLSILTLGRLRHVLVNPAGRLWARPCLAVAGIRLEITGWEHVARPQARVLIMNHQSMIEIFALAAMDIPRFTYLGKNQFKYIPVLGQAWWALGGHFVDRKNSAKARKSVARLGEDMRSHGLTALVAPEGTRSRSGALQPFKTGAFHLALDAGVPVVPLVFHDARQLAPPDGMRVSPGVLHVDFHPPVDSTGWDKENIRAEANRFHDLYAGWLAAGPRTGGGQVGNG